MDSVLVFGAGELQSSLIKNVKELGYRAIAIDPDNSAEGGAIADLFIQMASDDYDGTLSVAQEYEVKALVTTATDNPLPMMARIAENMNLRFPSYNSIISVLDKGKFKEIMMSNNVPCARGKSYFITEKPDLNLLDYPIIIKPNKNSGSRGVVKCENAEELAKELTLIATYCKDDKYIVEEYIKGDEISVEGLVIDGKISIIQITDKLVSPPPYNVEMAHIQPSKYLCRKNEINELLQKIIDLTGLNNCAIHPELKINGNGIFIIEIGPRLGGDFITSDLVPLSTGVNIEEALIQLSLGKELNLSIIDSASMIQYLALSPGSTLKEEITCEELKNQFPSLKKMKLYVNPGENAKPVTNSLNRHGWWIMGAENKESLISEAKNFIVSITKDKEETC